MNIKEYAEKHWADKPSDPNAYRNEMKELLGEPDKPITSYKEDKENLRIKHFGQCPKHKGHFNLDSFFAGMTLGILIPPLIGLIARLFK